ncbi:MAG: hypothetical protein ACR2PR_01785 [Pseudohongiellaceae bacterium]
MKPTTPQTTPILLLAGLLLATPVAAQEILTATDEASSFRIAPSSLLDEQAPLFSITRNTHNLHNDGTINEQELDGTTATPGSALDYNLGIGFSPLQGLNLRADAWRVEINDASGTNPVAEPPGIPRLYLDDSSINEFGLDSPLLDTNIDSTGIDLGASYVWETRRFGQFTLSTRATYVDQFDIKSGLAELSPNELNAPADRVVSPELQSSLMLSWQFGNHTASAITNYFDSSENIGELDMEAINDLVDNITTVDLQYGYSVTTGANDRAIISFGIKNIFNEKTAQILNSSTRILDQNGRVAYGAIKYQF